MCYTNISLFIVITDRQLVSNTSANVSLSQDGHQINIVIECNVSAADTEILGCISIIHKPANNSILVVMPISKETSISNVPVEVYPQTTYIYFVVLEWKVSGLIGSKELTKGKLCVNKHNSMIPASKDASIVKIVLTILAAGISIIIIIVFILVIIFFKIRKTKVINVARTTTSTSQAMIHFIHVSTGVILFSLFSMKQLSTFMFCHHS